MINMQEIIDRISGKTVEGVRSNSNDTFEILLSGDTTITINLENHYDDMWLEAEVSRNPSTWVRSSTPDLNQEIETLYDNGNGFIKAIKLCRERTGLSLKEAKMYIEKVVGIK
jgi:hypothetical protein